MSNTTNKADNSRNDKKPESALDRYLRNRYVRPETGESTPPKQRPLRLRNVGGKLVAVQDTDQK